MQAGIFTRDKTSIKKLPRQSPKIFLASYSIPAQCHDHPLAPEIHQEHYWGLVAFFNRSKNEDTVGGPRVAESAIGGFSEFTNLRGRSSPNQLVFFKSPVVMEKRPDKETKEEDRDELYYPANGTEPKIPKFSRREQFVEQVLDDHPLLAQAMVNRIWAWMFGRGLIHPVDAMDSYHPASHPESLRGSHVISRIRITICVECSAQHRAKPARTSWGPRQSSFDDPKWFASALAKPLTAEALYRSLQIALDGPMAKTSGTQCTMHQLCEGVPGRIG